MTKPKVKKVNEAPASKNLGGRPSLFKPEYLKTIRALALTGGSEVLMQDTLGISERTWLRWKLEKPEVLAALRVTDEEMFEIARSSVAKRAAGFERRGVKIVTVSLGKDHGSEVQEVPYVEYYPPDTTAAMWIMKNRDPSNWKDRQEVEQRGDVVVRVEGGLPDKEPEK